MPWRLTRGFCVLFYPWVCRRESFVSLLGACHEQSDESFWANVHESRWLHHVSTILKGRLHKTAESSGVEAMCISCLLGLPLDSSCDVHACSLSRRCGHRALSGEWGPCPGALVRGLHGATALTTLLPLYSYRPYLDT